MKLSSVLSVSVAAALVLSGCSNSSSAPIGDPELKKRNKFDACVIEEKAKERKKWGYAKGFLNETMEERAKRKAEEACVNLLR